MDWKGIESLLSDQEALSAVSADELSEWIERYPASPVMLLLKAGKQWQEEQQIDDQLWQKLLLSYPDKNQLIHWKQNGYTFGQPKPTTTSALEDETNELSEIQPVDEGETERNLTDILPDNIGFHWESESQSTLQVPEPENDPAAVEADSIAPFTIEHHIDHITFVWDDFSEKDLLEEESDIESLESIDHFDKDDISMDMSEEKPKVKKQKEKMEAEASEKKEVTSSYTDWLKQLSGKKTTVEEWSESKKAKKKRKKDPKESPKKLKKPKVAKDELLADKKKKKKKKKKSALKEIIDNSIQFEGGLVSETFASLLAQQGHIDHAIKMYEKLILIKPEKSSFFADRISELKNK